jgi:cytochrome c5
MRIKNIIVPAALLALLFAAAGCRHDDGRIAGYYYRTDMHEQPSIKPQEAPRDPVEGTVPITGFERPIRDTAEANRLENPVPRTSETNEVGRRLYNIHCSVCHGTGGKGDGPVAPVFQTPPDLTEERFVNVTDGYMYWIIRDGIGVMPPQYEHVRPHERWQIVNYIRSLQRE